MDKQDHIHQRNISISCFEGTEDRLIVEGTLSDERMFASLLYSANKELPAGFVHTIHAVMELALPTLEIMSIEVAMPVTPMTECTQTASVVKGLIGRRITGGFTSDVKRLIGGTKGCLHTTNLIIATASASVQGAWSHYSRLRENGAAVLPRNDESAVLNSCWLWREDGPLVARFRAAKRKLVFVVAIDGTAGSGKSTVSKALARRLDFNYLDTGVLYRALALQFIRAGIKSDDEEGVARIAHTARVELQDVAGERAVFLNGEDVSQAIRGEDVGMAASQFSALPAVRAALLAIQRRLGSQGHTVAAGRDMGSVVFPDAQAKIFLVAAAEERAKRRHKELIERGEPADWKRVLSDIVARDKQDSGRAIAPLVAATDAIIIDTTHLSAAAVVEKILAIVTSRR